MANVKQEHIIRQISGPSIVLDDIAVVDTESGVDNASIVNTENYPVKYSKVQGAAHPLIQINDLLFRDLDVVYVKIDTSGFLPTISVTLLMRTKILYSAGFPTDGDVLSIFIRSKDDQYKPIRNDYEITSVRVQGERSETSVNFIDISGVLSVTGLSSMKCFSNTGPSIDVLQKIAENLGLGFATNEVSTDDDQTWISPYKTVQSHIQEITESSWKDNKSFFTSFVDIFYHLNFVNVDPLFSIKPGQEMGISVESYSTDYDVDSALIKANLNILFTNHQMAKYSSQWINKYEQKNKANRVNSMQGYVKYNHYYDATLRKNMMVFNDPLSSPGSEDNMFIFKGRKNADQRFDRVTHNWMGTIYGANGENQHTKYLYAKTWNHQNMVHLDKLYLDVELDQINMTLRKYQVIPLLIIVQEDSERRQFNLPDDPTNAVTPTTENTPNVVATQISDENLAFVVEKFYTGDYVIQNITYQYQNGAFKQFLKLLRREWPAPSQISKT